MLGKHFKKFSTLLAIMNTEGTLRLALRGPHYKMTLRFHLTPVRMTNIKITATHHVEEDIEKRNSPPLMMGVQTCTTTLEINMSVSQK